jgi:hypothetical protein
MVTASSIVSMSTGSITGLLIIPDAKQQKNYERKKKHWTFLFVTCIL